MSDVKTFDKGGQLVRSRGQFKFIDPVEGRVYEAGVTYRADISEGTWLGGQLDAGAFTRVDEDGNELTIDGKLVKKATEESADPKDDGKAKGATTAPKK